MADGALPDVFREYFAGREEVHHPTRADGGFFHHCFGCGPAHPTGLRVRCFQADDGVVSPIVIAPQYAGPPSTAHGGIVTACLDEVLAGVVAHTTRRIAVTGELTVRFVKPVPVEQPILGRGRLVADHGRFIDVEGQLEEFGTGRVLATARGRFFPVPNA